jgi:hypothetical protein
MSLTWIVLSPISGIHANIDIVVGAFRVFVILVVPGRTLKKESKATSARPFTTALRDNVPSTSGEGQTFLTHSGGKGSVLRAREIIERRRYGRRDGSDGDNGCAARALCVPAEEGEEPHMKQLHMRQVGSQGALRRTKGPLSSRQ